MSNYPTMNLAMNRLNLMLSYLLISLALLGFSSHALAEAADRDKPIDLESDTVKVDDAKQISTYSGNVILTKGTLVIHADKLIVHEDSEGFQHSTSLANPVTKTPTTFKQKREGKNEYIEGSGQRIEYDSRMDKVQLYTKAWVKRGEDIVHGDYIMYDANAEYAEVIGGTKSSDSGTSSGRVHAIIQPKNKSLPKSGTTNPAPENAPDNSKSNAKPAGDNSLPPAKTMRFSRSLELNPDVK